MFGFDDIIGIGAGLLGGFLQNKGGKEQQEAAAGMSQADRDFYEKMYKQSLGDNRANQNTPYGSLVWEQDPNTGKWTQTVKFDPAEQGRLDDYRQIAADRMASAKGMSANFPQGAMNWDALGMGKIASAAGLPGGGNSDAIADARSGMGVIGQPGWQRQNPLIGGNGRPMVMPSRPQGGYVQGPSAGGGFIGGQAPGASSPPGPANLPGGRQPYVPAPITPPSQTPPPAAPAPAAPQAPQIDPNAQANFAAYLNSGHNTLTPEMYDHFGGDEMMKYVKSIDPNAKWTSTSTHGGEGGEGPMGKRLDFNPQLMAQLLKGGK